MSATRVAVVGSGPNGMAAAVTLAQAGLDVTVLERNPWIGGGAATRELTLPGFRHDVASAVHPMALASPFFQEFKLQEKITLITPEMSFAHPLTDGRAGLGYRDLDRAADALGHDGPAYRRYLRPVVDKIQDASELTLNSLIGVPTSPVSAAVFGARVAEEGLPWWNVRFREEIAPAMLTGCAAHTIGRHPSLASAGAGLMLAATAHARGWPVPQGGSQAIIDALAADLEARGGRVETDVDVTSADQLDDYDAVVLDVATPALVRILSDRLPASYRRRVERFRLGNGVAKVDFALDGPVPWTDSRISEAPTVHLGGTREQIAASEAAVARGAIPDHPFVLVVQPCVVDPSRAPEGKATFWAYMHVPAGSDFDPTEAIVGAVERHAPGFRDLILGSAVTRACDFESRVSANFVGGDFSSGAVTLGQMVARPVLKPTPWRIPVEGYYLASGSAVPGPSVHGMGGFHAARTLLADAGVTVPSLA